jgi:hypothetical protein
MRSTTAIAVGVLLAGVLAGCCTASKAIPQKSQGEKTSVFVEVRGDEPIPRGSADLAIAANIKTHVDGYYVLESKESRHGKQRYPFVINIDGQAITWEVDGVRESKPAYDDDGKTSRDPEAREGFRYVLGKKVRLRAGAHRVFFGLPEENYSVEVEIALEEGKMSVLEFRPVYRYKTDPTRIPTFLRGVERYDVFLNGQPVLMR